MAYTFRTRRFHTNIIREANGTYTLLWDRLGGLGGHHETRGFRTRDEALDSRDSVRRMAAAAGWFPCTTCCA